MNTTIQLLNGAVVTTTTQSIPQAQYISQQQALIIQWQNNIDNLTDSIAKIQSNITATQASIDQVS